MDFYNLQNDCSLDEPVWYQDTSRRLQGLIEREAKKIYGSDAKAEIFCSAFCNLAVKASDLDINLVTTIAARSKRLKKKQLHRVKEMMWSIPGIKTAVVVNARVSLVQCTYWVKLYYSCLVHMKNYSLKFKVSFFSFCMEGNTRNWKSI